MKKKFDFDLGLKEDDDVDAINLDNKINLGEPKRGPLAAVKESMIQIKTGGA